MAGIWTHRFTVVLRPLRDRAGEQTTVVLESRTAAQANREATLRYPEMKVVSVTRVVEPVAVLNPRDVPRARVDAAASGDALVLPVSRARRA